SSRRSARAATRSGRREIESSHGGRSSFEGPHADSRTLSETHDAAGAGARPARALLGEPRTFRRSRTLALDGVLRLGDGLRLHVIVRLRRRSALFDRLAFAIRDRALEERREVRPDDPHAARRTGPP